MQAMARWPNVPAVYGWLRLDRRGRWLIKGEPITNTVVTAFIDRNYLPDDAGRWYFQNGPQQVFVELEYTPYVYRLWRNTDQTLSAETHTGLPVNEPAQCWLDDAGGVLIESEHGVGCVESHSLVVLESALSDCDGQALSENAMDALLAGADPAAAGRLNWGNRLLPVGFIALSAVPARFGFNPAPQPQPGQAPC